MIVIAVNLLKPSLTLLHFDACNLNEIITRVFTNSVYIPCVSKIMPS